MLESYRLAYYQRRYEGLKYRYDFGFKLHFVDVTVNGQIYFFVEYELGELMDDLDKCFA